MNLKKKQKHDLLSMYKKNEKNKNKLSQEIRESMEKYKQINSVEFSKGEDNENF